MPGLTTIATQTTSTTVSSIDFTSIPSGYTHLKLVVNSSNGPSAFAGCYIRVGNGSFDSGNNYPYIILINDGTSPKANFGTLTGAYGAVIEQDQAFMNIFYIWNYASTNMYKTIANQGASIVSGSKYRNSTVSTWKNTAAINQIQFFASGTTIKSGTTATLFGITGV